MSDDLLSRLGKVAREQDEEARALEGEQPDMSELLRARVLAQAKEQLAPRKRSWPRTPVLLGAAVAAAAIMFVWLRPTRQRLPAYALTVSGTLDEMRGPAEAAVLRFGPSSRVELVMRPADDVTTLPDLRLWLEQDGHGHRLPVPSERSATGTLRVVRSGGELFSESPGRSRLTVFVCLPSECSRSEEQLRNGKRLPAAEATQLDVEYDPRH